MLQDKISEPAALPKTIRWLDALSQTDIDRMVAFAQSNLFPIRKETKALLENLQKGVGYEPTDRVTMGKIQIDLRKFLAVMAFADQLPQAVHTNFWMLKAMRSRLKKAGLHTKVGFEWDIYEGEVSAFRNKADKEGEWKKVAEAESDYLSSKSEGGKWVESDEKIGQQRDQAIDKDYLSTRFRSLCISLNNAQRRLPKGSHKLQQNPAVNDAQAILAFAKKISTHKPPNLQFYIDYTEYLMGRIQANPVDSKKVRSMLSLLDHPHFLPDQIAYALAFSVVIAALNEGQFEFYRPLYDFLKRGIMNGRLRDMKNLIPLAYYRTFTQTGILAQKEKDLKPLLSVWMEDLAAAPAKRMALFKHCMAMVYLRERKYSLAWRTSQEAQFSLPNFLWFHAELQFRIQFEAEYMGQPIFSEKGLAWEDSREELIDEMKKYVSSIRQSRYAAQGDAFQVKTEMYEVLERGNMLLPSKRKKIKELAEKSLLNQLDIEWFAKMIKAEAEFLRPRA